MERLLVAKVKSLLSGCTSDNYEQYKKKLMIQLKPDEADMIYEYFTRIESEYVKDTHKVHAYLVLPQYNDYFTNNVSAVKDFIFDDYSSSD